MKNKALLLLGIVSVISSLLTLGSGLAIKFLWGKILEDEPLPELSHFGLNYGFVFVLILGVLSIFLHFKSEESKQRKLFETISIVEILYLSLIVYTYFLPFRFITWSLG